MASARAVVRCGHCKADFVDASRAAAHITTHAPKRRPVSSGQPLFRVRWNRSGEIAEVLPQSLKVGVQIERGEGPETGAGGSVSAVPVIGDGHKGSAALNTPCLCNCHYGKPDCNERGCF